MMYTLYGSKNSGSAMVEAALHIAQQEFRLVDAASWQEGPGLEELKNVNPLAQIPTLVLPGGEILTESAAILIHLGLQFPASGLLPHDAAERATAIRGLVYIAANCYAAIGIIDYPERWCQNADEDDKARIKQGARQRLHHYWDMFADSFPLRTGSEFFGHTSPGALDLMAVVVSRWSGSRAHLARSRPAFHQLLLRIEQHSAYAAVHFRHWPPA